MNRPVNRFIDSRSVSGNFDKRICNCLPRHLWVINLNGRRFAAAQVMLSVPAQGKDEDPFLCKSSGIRMWTQEIPFIHRPREQSRTRSGWRWSNSLLSYITQRMDRSFGRGLVIALALLALQLSWPVGQLTAQAGEKSAKDGNGSAAEG